MTYRKFKDYYKMTKNFNTILITTLNNDIVKNVTWNFLIKPDKKLNNVYLNLGRLHKTLDSELTRQLYK